MEFFSSPSLRGVYHCLKSNGSDASGLTTIFSTVLTQTIPVAPDPLMHPQQLGNVFVHLGSGHAVVACHLGVWVKECLRSNLPDLGDLRPGFRDLPHGHPSKTAPPWEELRS
jgi:hypothetical protein